MILPSWDEEAAATQRAGSRSSEQNPCASLLFAVQGRTLEAARRSNAAADLQLAARPAAAGEHRCARAAATSASLPLLLKMPALSQRSGWRRARRGQQREAPSLPGALAPTHSRLRRPLLQLCHRGSNQDHPQGKKAPAGRRNCCCGRSGRDYAPQGENAPVARPRCCCQQCWQACAKAALPTSGSGASRASWELRTRQSSATLGARSTSRARAATAPASAQDHGMARKMTPAASQSAASMVAPPEARLRVSQSQGSVWVRPASECTAPLERSRPGREEAASCYLARLVAIAAPAAAHGPLPS